MKHHNNTYTTSNFWFGFALGILSFTTISYYIGTKKGREHLKKIIEFAERYDGKPEEIFELIHQMAESKTTENQDVKTNLSTLMDKVKSITKTDTK